jgi:pimeloyl-ACP methyl ester carboxylesterase
LSTQQLTLPDGRKLAYTVLGKGAPVIYFHGTASSRLEVLLLKQLVDLAQVQLIGVDRPGYGLSSYKQRKSLVDFNGDVDALVDFLGFERFSVLGWSGGGAFALAYLALNPDRVDRAVLVSTPALPFDVSTAHNMPAARYIMKLPYVGYFPMRQLSRQLLRCNGDIAKFLATQQGKQLLHGCSKGDLKFFTDPHWMTLMYQSMTEAFHQGNAGVKAVVDEHRLFTKPWNLPLSKLDGRRLWIWHGNQDLTCRINNAYANAKAMPTANLQVFEDAGHCVMFQNIDKLAKILSGN